MHIGFQRSGGRGEYEVVGNHSAYTASSLEGWRFYMRWPDKIVRETGLELEPAGSGKPRLRSTWSEPFQIGRMIAAMLMLPDPRREYAQTNPSQPIARSKGYVLAHIGFGPDTEFTGHTDLVTIDPSFVTLVNLAGEEAVGVPQRWRRVQAIYAVVDQLPDAVRGAVMRHRDYLASGVPVTSELTSVVAGLVKSLDPASGGDPLPILERLAGLPTSDEPTLPPPDEIGEEEPDVSVRSAAEYRLARARGASAVRFRKQIREAYGNRCMFCGGVFGGIPRVRSGVDAAHILAWHKYDLDVVKNGLCLCKLHHWAFDSAIMLPVYRAGRLHVSFSAISVDLDEHSLSLLGVDGAEIPLEYLPAAKKDWPSERYLEHLYADLAISFSA